ncbi:Anti-sigma regulatory factor (Ser/Thr protein kinase) [Nonomuraea solani]|uniref:Anti-sigma regulatory factor (Ser/Thr protein kinase) n=2 Tax=Nonomuraea solani TaxID=1144553 RepID=A0A1H6F180_9ACTN|nr:Anti-sigma regulatory factor (Ser/Thr protein kinase) [Nonomuraea solani]
MTWSFTRADARHLRRSLATHVAGRGLSGVRCAEFVLAVHEGVMNVVEHGGGAGRVRLWRARHLLCCEISDGGPGIPTQCLDRAGMPGPDGECGRGLWLMDQLTDTVTVTSGLQGTVIQISVRLPA